MLTTTSAPRTVSTATAPKRGRTTTPKPVTTAIPGTHEQWGTHPNRLLLQMIPHGCVFPKPGSIVMFQAFESSSSWPTIKTGLGNTTQMLFRAQNRVSWSPEIIIMKMYNLIILKHLFCVFVVCESLTEPSSFSFCPIWTGFSHIERAVFEFDAPVFHFSFGARGTSVLR